MTRSLLWQDKMCVVARQDLCCGRIRSLLCHDIREFTKGRGAKRRAPLWRRREAPPPLCLGTREILSCHNRDLVLPQHTSCLATTEILSCHNRHCVFPEQKAQKGQGSQKGPKGPKGPRVPKGPKGSKRGKGPKRPKGSKGAMGPKRAQRVQKCPQMCKK